MNHTAGANGMRGVTSVDFSGPGVRALASQSGRKNGGEPGGESRSADLAAIPEEVKASAASTPGIYDARRLRSQREIIRDVMLSAAECNTWLTLGELRALTCYGEASISAQLRHLRKGENGGYEVVKRHREGASLERPGVDGRSECVWEYRIARAGASCAETDERLRAACDSPRL